VKSKGDSKKNQKNIGPWSNEKRVNENVPANSLKIEKTRKIPNWKAVGLGRNLSMVCKQEIRKEEHTIKDQKKQKGDLKKKERSLFKGVKNKSRLNTKKGKIGLNKIVGKEKKSLEKSGFC